MSRCTRSYETAKRLVKAGHEVQMITTCKDKTEHSDWFRKKTDGIDVHWQPNAYDSIMSFKKESNHL